MCISLKIRKVGISIYLLFLLNLSVEVFAVNISSLREISIQTRQYAISSGDLNKDGFPDIVVGGDPLDTQIGKVRILLGRGNGNFQYPIEYSVGFNQSEIIQAPFINRIKIADMNGDGNLDVIVSHNDSRSQFNNSRVLVSILFGNGDGTLETSDGYVFASPSPNVSVRSIDTYDMDNDGDLDVLVGCWQNNFGQIYIVRNQGNDQFSVHGPQELGAMVFTIRGANIDNDGLPDAVATTDFGNFTFYGSTSPIRFFENIDHFDQGLNESGLIIEDLNKDGLDDFVTAERFTPNLRVFLNQNGKFIDNPVVYETQLNSDLLKTTDLNKDGITDVLKSASTGTGLEVFYGRNDGTFAESFLIPNTIPLSDFVTDDFDLNGKEDIAFSIGREPPLPQAGLLLNAPNQSRYYSDFNGDTSSDYTIYRPETGTWWTLFSDDLSYNGTQFGLPTDVPVAGNYDGDNKADLAVYREGVWFVLNSSDGSVSIEHWGLPDDIPVPADFTNDGYMNFAVYRPTEGIWYIKKDDGFDGIRWGIKTDKPVPRDYDGDGKTDAAVWRDKEGIWYILRSSDNQLLKIPFGLPEDIPVPNDYDGDGKADVAVYRNGVWYILESETGEVRYETFGLPTDIPIPNDFDGDGKNDVAVFRPNDGFWYVLRSSDRRVDFIRWGISVDIPN